MKTQSFIHQKYLTQDEIRVFLNWMPTQEFRFAYANRISPEVCWWGNTQNADGCDRLISDEPRIYKLVNKFHHTANCAALWRYKAEYASPDRFDPPGQPTVGIAIINSHNPDAIIRARWNGVMRDLRNGQVIQFSSEDRRSFYCSPHDHYFLELRKEDPLIGESHREKIKRQIVDRLSTLELHHLMYLDNMTKCMKSQ